MVKREEKNKKGLPLLLTVIPLILDSFIASLVFQE